MNKIFLIITTFLLMSCNSTEPKVPNPEIPIPDGSVMVLNEDQNSGGSGTVIHSGAFVSVILTNKHVCRVIEPGGFIAKGNSLYPIDAYKKYPKHDLCLVRVLDYIPGEVEIASRQVDINDMSRAIGHPLLSPTIISDGFFSTKRFVKLIVGYKPCDAKTDPKYWVYCFRFGMVPVVETFVARITSSTVRPGSSGSGVFNDNGELSAVVFAGSGSFSYGALVPLSYVKNFLNTHRRYSWREPDGTEEKSKLYRRIFSVQNECLNPKTKFKSMCSMISNNLLYWGK